MSRLPDEERALTAAESYEYASDEDDGHTGDQPPSNATSARSIPSRPGQTFAARSHYHLSTPEQLKGVANRIIFSRYYVIFYFVMMCLSLGTVVLSLVATRECCAPYHYCESSNLCYMHQCGARKPYADSRPETVPSGRLAHTRGDRQRDDGPGDHDEVDSVWQGACSSSSRTPLHLSMLVCEERLVADGRNTP
jgi:hypothetical protein